MSIAPTVQAQSATEADGLDVGCLARDTLNDYLSGAYGEGRIAQAQLQNGHQVELFLSRRGTWTLVELMPDGQGCIHAYGQHMKVDGNPQTKHKPS